MTSEYTLPPIDNARIFRDQIWPAVAGPGASVRDEPRQRSPGDPPPRAVGIIAPPAHLKSTLQSTMSTDVAIDVDNFFVHHPAYEGLALSGDRDAPDYFDDDVRRWRDTAFSFAIQQKLDIVSSSGWSDYYFSEMRDKGWTTEAIFIAGDEAICDLRRLKRYIDDVETVGYGMWIPREVYVYDYHIAVPKVAEQIQVTKAADHLTILDRNLEPVRHFTVMPEGDWDQPFSARFVLSKLRSEPWTGEEFAEAHEKITDLNERLPEDLLPDLVQAVRTAQRVQEGTALQLEGAALARLAELRNGQSPTASALGPAAPPEAIADAIKADNEAVSALQDQAKDFRSEGSNFAHMAEEIAERLDLNLPDLNESISYQESYDGADIPQERISSM